MSEFKNKWAIILGGSSGLGLASALKLASEGLNLCIVHRDPRINLPAFQAEVEKMEAFGITVKTYNKSALNEDVQDEIIAALPKKSVRLLLHSIAKGSLKNMSGSDNDILKKEDLDITIHAMATSWYFWTQRLIKENVFAENSRNIAFTSEGNTKAWEGYAAVSVAKVVLESLMRNMALEFAPLGIRTNCIQAGTTRTPSFLVIPGSEKLAEMAEQRNPFKKLTKPEDVANVVYLLCKSEADWINGTIIKADGGESNS